jgi:hypothetical protein
MAQKDPAFVATKWAQNLGAATESIRQGVLSVTEAPGAAAARKKADYVRRVTERADHWATRVAGVSREAWQAATIDKGLPRVASGAQQAQPKMQAFMQEFLPHVERVAQQVRSMPKGGLENGIARATAQIRGNASFRRSGS